MQRASRPEGLDLLPGRMQRSQSVSSDRTSISTAPSLTSPPPVAPDPAYIAASAASQIVTSDHQSQIDDWFHGDEGKEEFDTIAVSPASLTLINGFLDHLLFSILAFARSTSIASLRPAVTEVLKPRLAKDAIDGADQELKEFLGGGDAEELSAFHNGRHQPRGKWDLNLVWRRTRLRCMVYTRLGDMEEEDEEMYIEQEHLEHGTNGDRRISRELALVSPAAAIFLTSILEFIGEHALMVAGEAASNRMDIRQHRDGHHPSTGSTETPRLAVEDIDVEKLAFNTTLGRLWRSWKKRVRLSGSRPLSRELARRRAASSSASPSLGEVEDPSYPHEMGPRPLVPDVLEEEQETARTPRNTETETAPHAPAPEPEPRAAIGSGPRFGNRPHSMMVQPSADPPLTPLLSSSSPSNPRDTRPRPPYMDRRKRSTSLPNLRLLSEFPLSPKDTSVAPHEIPAEVAPVDHGPTQVDERAPPDQGNPKLLPEDDDPSDVDDVVAPGENGDPVDLGTLSGYTGPQSSQSLSGSTMAVPGMKTFRVDRGRESLTKPPAELEAAMTWPIIKHAEREPGTAVSADDGSREVRGLPGVNRMRNGPSTEATEVHGMSKVQDDLGPQQPQLYTGWASEREWKRHLKSLQELPPSALAVRHGDASLLQSQPDIEEQDPAQSHAPYPPPIRRSHRTTPDATHHRKDVDDRDLRQVPNNATAHPRGAEYGALSLTPLKEIVDTGRGVSNDSALFAPSHHTPRLEKNASPQPSSDLNLNGKISNSLPSSARSQSRQSSRGEESTQRRKIPLFVDTSRPERAAVQRITPSPKDQSLLNRTSTSSNRETRPHTAASGTSQFSQKVKGLIGRESTDSTGRPPARRNSSAGSGSVAGEKGNPSTSAALSKQQSFEKLIKSDETIQYTLTPRNVRDLEVQASPKLSLRHSPKNSKGTNSYSSPEPANVEPRTSTSPGRSVASVKVLKALRSHPAGTNRNGSISDRPPSQPGREPSQATSRTTRGTVPNHGQPHTNDLRLANGRPGEVVPRDAKAKKETTSEIADFIRSTGPETIRQIPASNVEADMEPLRSNPAKSVNPKATPTERTNSRRVTKPHPALLPKSAGTASSKRPGPKLQARDAIIAHDEQTSDLIDFIRQGPAPDRSDGSRRIPRSVAPFRRTMDSDEIQALSNGKAKDASSVTSTQDGLAQPQSVRSSSNSRTGLLESAKRWNGGQHHTTSKPFRLDEPPRRKQHRNKDPYAIDIDGEDDEGLSHGAEPSAHKETLVEFLRSMSPPRPGPTGSSLDNTPEANKKSMTKKSSGQNVREQFARATSSVHAAKTSISKPTIINITEAQSYRGREKSRQAPPVSPLETSPHLVTQNGKKYDGYKPTYPTYIAHIDRDRIAPRHGRLEPRGEREPEPGLSELADFFKNSGPPTPPLETSPPGLGLGKEKEKEEGGLSRLFRRKKSAAKL